MVNKNLEIEYKTMVSKKELENLLNYFPGNSGFYQVNYYYQSNDDKDKIFRIRHIHNNFIFTYKDKVKDGKLEYEIELGSLDLNNKEMNEVLASFGFTKPYTLVGTMTTFRIEIELKDEAHLCLDSNEYSNKKDYEIEYEITGKKGSLDNFIKILNQANIKYIPSRYSKQKRAVKAYTKQ